MDLSSVDRPAEERGPDFLDVLARALRVVDALGAARNPTTLSDLAAAARLPRASARRVLLTLRDLGYVEADGRTFRLTPKILTLATAYLAADNVPVVMQPIVERVSSLVAEACSAAVLDGDDVVFIARATPTRILSVGLEIGYRLPAHSTAVGRVMIADWEEARLEAYLARDPLKSLTERTITDAARFKAEIAAVRASGYALVDQETERGFRSLAVPVRRGDGRLRCAIHIGVNVGDVSVQRTIDEFLPALREAAAEATPMLI